MSQGRRQHERFDVHLSVSYRTAEEYVSEYAENLSMGGLFLGGAHDLPPLSLVSIEVDLPGFRRFQVVAQVVRIVTPAQARSTGLRAGVGLALVDPSSEFQEALHRYLLRLGRRRDATVLVADMKLADQLRGAGFRTQSIPPAERLVAELTRAEPRAVAALVPPAELIEYRSAAARGGAEDLVWPVPADAELGELLRLLDDSL